MNGTPEKDEDLTTPSQTVEAAGQKEQKDDKKDGNEADWPTELTGITLDDKHPSDEEKKKKEGHPKMIYLWQEWCSAVNTIGRNLNQNHEVTTTLASATESKFQIITKKIGHIEDKVDLILHHLEHIKDQITTEDQDTLTNPEYGEPSTKKSRNESLWEPRSPTEPKSNPDQDFTSAPPVEEKGVWAMLMEEVEEPKPSTKLKTIANVYKIPKLKARPTTRGCLYCRKNHRDMDCDQKKTAKERILHLRAQKTCPFCGAHEYRGTCDKEPPKCGKCAGRHMTSICMKTYK